MTGLPDGWRMLSLNEVAHGGLFNDGDWVKTKDQDPQGSVRLTQLADVGVGEFRDRSSRWLLQDQDLVGPGRGGHHRAGAANGFL
jgi:type I restriction enzyme S subunit